jgi:hypothetical protein
LVCAAGLLAPAAARAQGPAEILAGRHHTVHFDVRFRIGSRAEAAADLIAANAERELTDICRALAIEPRQRLSLWLYDDATELRRIQAGRRDTVGDIEAATTRSFALVRMFTTGHDAMVARFPKTTPSPRAHGLTTRATRFISFHLWRAPCSRSRFRSLHSP